MYYRRRWFVYSLIPVVIASGAMIFVGNPTRWLNTFGLMITILGVFQLEISGIFDRAADVYADDAKWPGGPPSPFCREMFRDDNPDQPIRSAIRSHLFHRPRTGLWLVVTGCLAQLAAVWV